MEQHKAAVHIGHVLEAAQGGVVFLGKKRRFHQLPRGGVKSQAVAVFGFTGETNKVTQFIQIACRQGAVQQSKTIRGGRHGVEKTCAIGQRRSSGAAFILPAQCGCPIGKAAGVEPVFRQTLRRGRRKRLRQRLRDIGGIGFLLGRFHGHRLIRRCLRDLGRLLRRLRGLLWCIAACEKQANEQK